MPFAPEQFAHVSGHQCAEELRFVVAALKRDPDGSLAAVSHTEDTPVDSERLLELARLNKVINVLPNTAEELPPGCEGLIDQIGRARLISASLNRRGLEAAAEIAQRLTANDIEHVHLKGPLQQIDLFGDYHQKPSADIDILVRPRDRKNAIRAIVAEGYEAKDSQTALWWILFLHELHFENPIRRTMIDLHHGLQHPGFPSPRNLSSFIENARTLTFEGTNFRVPDARNRVLLAAISIVKAFLGREPALSSVADLRAALGRLTDDERSDMVRFAQSLRLERIYVFAVQFVTAVFGQTTAPRSQAIPVLPSLTPETLRLMIATPWIDGLPWPRRHEILSDLCGNNLLLYVHESVQSLLSESLRKTLEFRASFVGKAR